MESNVRPIMNLANSIVGVSILAMSYCFFECGILLGTLLLLLCTLFTAWTCKMLMRSAIMTRNHSYENLALGVFGKTGKYLTGVCVIGLSLGCCIAFFVIIGDLAPPIVAQTTGIIWSPAYLRATVLILSALLVAFPLGLCRSVDSLSGISLCSLLFYALLTVQLFYFALPHLSLGWLWDNVSWWKNSGLLKCIPIFGLAYACQTQLFVIYRDLKDPSFRRIASIIDGATSSIAVLYFLVAFLGYVSFSQDGVRGDVLANFNVNFMSQLFRFGFSVSVLVSFPLVIFPCRVSINSLFFSSKSLELHVQEPIPQNRFVAITAFIIGLTLTVAILIPNVETVLGLTGATTGSLLCFILPSAIFLKVAGTKADFSNRARLCAGVGVAVLLLSTVVILQSEMNADPVRNPVKGARPHPMPPAIKHPVDLPPGDHDVHLDQDRPVPQDGPDQQDLPDRPDQQDKQDQQDGPAEDQDKQDHRDRLPDQVDRLDQHKSAEEARREDEQQRDRPDQPVHQDINGNGADDGGVAPPKEDGGVAVPKEDGGVAVPKEDGGVAAPKEDGGVAAPKEDGGVAVPMDGGVAVVPKEDGVAAPKKGGGVAAPVDGGVADPKKDAGVAAPMDGDVAAPMDGGVAAPMDGGVAVPKEDGGVAAPEGGGVASSRGAAPNDGGVAAPMDGGVADGVKVAQEPADVQSLHQEIKKDMSQLQSRISQLEHENENLKHRQKIIEGFQVDDILEKNPDVLKEAEEGGQRPGGKVQGGGEGGERAGGDLDHGLIGGGDMGGGRPGGLGGAEQVVVENEPVLLDRAAGGRAAVGGDGLSKVGENREAEGVRMGRDAEPMAVLAGGDTEIGSRGNVGVNKVGEERESLMGQAAAGGEGRDGQAGGGEGQDGQAAGGEGQDGQEAGGRQDGQNVAEDKVNSSNLGHLKAGHSSNLTKALEGRRSRDLKAFL